MADFNKLEWYQKKEILNALIFEGLTYPQITERYNIDPSEIAELINEKAVVPYNLLFPKEHPNQDEEHKKTVFGWIKGALGLVGVSFAVIVILQVVLGGLNLENITSSLAYVTSPLSKMMNIGLGVAVIVVVLFWFFPILTTFINEKVNTVSLKDTFLKARPESKLNFLAMIVLSLCILVGLVFSAKAQDLPRECVIKTAKAELGVLEKGGNNRGQRIDYFRSVSLGKTVKGYNDAWCGYFVSYCFKSCNIPHSVKFSPRARDWFVNSKQVVWKRNFKTSVLAKKPQAGDLVGYIFRAGTIGHIEILYEFHEDENYFLSIGGNTSAKSTLYRDTDTVDGVRLKKRDLATAYVISNHID